MMAALDTRRRHLILACALVALVGGCGRDVDTAEPGDAWDDVGTAELPEVDFWPGGDVIRVATWNVERYFDTVCDSGHCGVGTFEALPSLNTFRADTERVARGIAALDAHVILLQEVESERCLDALSEQLPNYPVALLAETESPGSINVGVFARGRLIEARRHRDRLLELPDGTTTTFAREFLEVRLKLTEGDAGPGATPDVIVFVAHFKSKRGDEPERRIAEAREAREIVLETAAEFPEALIVMGGDLNDTPDSEPLETLTGDGALRRVADDVADHLVATYTFSGTARAIDHLLLATAASGDYVRGTARSVGYPGGHAGSDHAALTAWFQLP